ncbi:MAG: DUF4357 domain-containing protein [Eggerthellaceae bacterium]|nr:DUF4357 domain-containing protein [Eggerthellaceae bacterium]
MAKGIIYAMTTVVHGLVKIGKTGQENFEQRMRNLERNGYFNVTGLKRAFAIEVEDYDEKEAMLDDIFSRSRVPNSELFALDIDLVMQLLSSFEGRQVYPKSKPKEQVFEQATEERHANLSNGEVPDGEYTMNRKLKRAGKAIEATMIVRSGTFVIPAGTQVCMVEGTGLSEGVRQLRTMFVDEDGTSTEDVEFTSPSSACSFVIGASANGWVNWQNAEGDYIDVYRERES